MTDTQKMEPDIDPGWADSVFDGLDGVRSAYMRLGNEARRTWLRKACETMKACGLAEQQTAYVIVEMLKCACLFDRKQRAYSSRNIALTGGDRGVAIRLMDKATRLLTLYESGEDPDWESVRDTWMDVVNYGAIALTCIAGEWEGYEPERD